MIECRATMKRELFDKERSRHMYTGWSKSICALFSVL
jgi:hypothetical protein